MNRIYNLSQRLIACVLFIGLFLQSCGGQNQLVPQEKNQQSRAIELLDNPLFNTDKEIVISGGYLASFYEEDGELKADLRADAIQPQPNYKGIPVVIEEGTNLTDLTKLNATMQKNRIELNRSDSSQSKHVSIRKGGIIGGMKRVAPIKSDEGEKEKEAEKEKKDEITQLMKVADSGNREAQFRLGKICYEKAIEYYSSAAKQGHLEANAMLIKMGYRSYTNNTKRKLTLVGENHATITGMKYCYDAIVKFLSNSPQQKLNFFIEKDEQRLNNACKEVGYLTKLGIFNLHFNAAIEKYKNYIRNQELKIEDKQLYIEAYTNIIGKSDEEGRLENRFWFLRIIRDFYNKIEIFPIDGNFIQVINHPRFNPKNFSSNMLHSTNYDLARKYGTQASIDDIMSTDHGVFIRDEIMIDNLKRQIGSDTKNIALVGGEHVTGIIEGMANDYEVDYQDCTSLL